MLVVVIVYMMLSKTYTPGSTDHTVNQPHPHT